MYVYVILYMITAKLEKKKKYFMPIGKSIVLFNQQPKIIEKI